MKHGIVIIALGYELYGSCAYNLALTIKAYDPLINICIIHDNNAIKHLTPQELSFFDKLIEADKNDYTIRGKKEYQRLKVCVDIYSPYDLTLYMDADNAWFPGKKVSWFFGELLGREFVIGQNGYYDIALKKISRLNYTFWAADSEPETMVKYHELTNNIPQTVSGLFAFKKSSATKKIFEEARKVYDDPKAPCMPWAGGKPDEYCFNVALSKAGFQQEDKHIFFFKNINGSLRENEVYQYYWGIATGGTPVPKEVATLYNRIVNKCSHKLGIESRHYHKDKQDFIPERKSK